MDKMNYEELLKLYSEFMDNKENEFFSSGSHGWTKAEFVQQMVNDQKMVIDYLKVVKPLIDNGQMYLN